MLLLLPPLCLLLLYPLQDLFVAEYAAVLDSTKSLEGQRVTTDQLGMMVAVSGQLEESRGVQWTRHRVR